MASISLDQHHLWFEMLTLASQILPDTYENVARRSVRSADMFWQDHLPLCLPLHPPFSHGLSPVDVAHFSKLVNRSQSCMTKSHWETESRENNSSEPANNSNFLQRKTCLLFVTYSSNWDTSIRWKLPESTTLCWQMTGLLVQLVHLDS